MYGWDRNKGYGTREHRNAIRIFGNSPFIERASAYCRNRVNFHFNRKVSKTTGLFPFIAMGSSSLNQGISI